MPNVDVIFQIAGIGILIAIFSIVLEQAQRKEQGQMLTLVGVVVILLIVLNLIADLFETIRTIFHL
ncbi:stage III sporulation protein AC [Proteinivorax hydrogeniformans]|uniref:Stage III sporulation protein AC n=1 Tax=Proteinivorax hydrogeniformans TaxID=1826727 RepID=A0AAU8HQI4_9FIRM